MTLEEIKNNRELVNVIDWDMTPEEAVRLYLEWGNNWVRGNYVIRSKDDVTHYFVVNTWKKDPIIYLIRRNSENADELAEFKMPQSLKEKYISENGRLKGVFAVSGGCKKMVAERTKCRVIVMGYYFLELGLLKPIIYTWINGGKDGEKSCGCHEESWYTS